jgi:dGTPase
VRGLHEKEPDATRFDPDGYEGNAQTFRILTKLAVRYDTEQCSGLDLTRATLAATHKYPWLRNHAVDKKRDKWSAYATEKTDFEWATQFGISEEKSAEAYLMDWADDIAYSVHDLEDFHRVGVIPWAQIFSARERDRLVNEVVSNWFNAPADAPARVRSSVDRIKDTVDAFPAVTEQIYDGSREQRRQLRNLTSILIGSYVRSVSLAPVGEESVVRIDPDAADDVRLLKQLARHYVIGLPALSAQQYGQRKVIKDLFSIFLTEGSAGNMKMLPPRMRYIWEDHHNDKPARLAADCVACLTETEAIQLHRRLTGMDSGSILDPIVR